MLAIDSKKAARVDDLAEYAAGQPSELCFNSVDEAYTALYSKHMHFAGQDLANYYFVNVLRFWGSLTKPQRDALRNGGSLKAAGLSEQAKFWLTENIYGIPRAYSSNFVTPHTLPPLSTARRNIKSSPYESLADGIPADTLVTGTPGSEVGLTTVVKDQESYPSDPENLGYWFANEGWKLDGDQSPLVSVSIARSPSVKITFDFGHGCSAWTQIADEAESWSAPMKYGDLPDDIRKRVEARYNYTLDEKARADAKVKARTIPPYLRRGSSHRPWHRLPGDVCQSLPGSGLRLEAGGTHRLEGGATFTRSTPLAADIEPSSGRRRHPGRG